MSLENVNLINNAENEDVIENIEVNNLTNDDFNLENIGMIPCEICETMISFNDYSRHITHCARVYDIQNERFNRLNGFIDLLNTSSVETYFSDVNGNINNINTIRVPLDDEIINDNEDNVEYTDENDNNDENIGNVNNTDVNNNDVNSDEEEVVNTDNTVNENNDDLVEPYEQFINNLTPRPIRRRLSVSNNNSFRVRRNNILSNNIGRRLLRDVEISIGNLHNLTYQNNNTNYNFDILFETLIENNGFNEKRGIKDFNKVITTINEEDLTNEDECSICYDNLKKIINNEYNNETKLNCPVKTSCGHNYCRECIYKWLSKNKKCPICNNKFEEDEDEDTSMNYERYDGLPSLISDEDIDSFDEFPPLTSQSSNN